MLILGLNAYHGDSAACLLRDGALVAAAEEERFRRIKHWAGFPSQAIAYCLDEAGAKLEDISHVAVNHDARANFWPRIGYLLKSRPRPAAVLDRLRRRFERGGIKSHFDAPFGPGRLRASIENAEHHESHLAPPYFGSRFD